MATSNEFRREVEGAERQMGGTLRSTDDPVTAPATIRERAADCVTVQRGIYEGLVAVRSRVTQPEPQRTATGEAPGPGRPSHAVFALTELESIQAGCEKLISEILSRL